MDFRPLGGAFATLLVFTTLSFAQGTADIVGRVTDSSGGVLPAVTVTVENIATKSVRTTVTTDTGDYVFTLLPIGPYSVRIELQGFQTVNAKVELATGDRIEVGERRAEGTRAVRFDGDPATIMAAAGEMPLPPYIRDRSAPPDRYPTVYARPPGSAAAPGTGACRVPVWKSRPWRGWCPAARPCSAAPPANRSWTGSAPPGN